MIVKRKWIQVSKGGSLTWEREGWYFLGIFPLYIRDLEGSKRKSR